MKIGYIVSLKKGIHRFIYRELCFMEKDFEFVLYPTKFAENIYNPKKSWEVFHYNKIATLAKQPFYFFKNPFTYGRLFGEALFSSSLIDFFLANEFARHMKEAKVDRIHCHFGDRKFVIGYYCKRLLGIPLSVTIHAHELRRNPNWKMFKQALKYCDVIVSISEYNKKLLIKNFDVPQKKIKVIRLFVDDKPQAPQKRRRSTKKAILTIGSFEERKGYDVLLKALKKLKRDDYELWVVGSGHLPVKEWAEGLPVKFLGNLHSKVLNKVMASCDIYVQPSKLVKVKPLAGTNMTAPGYDTEGIPVSLMEAMQAGKPVISTYHAGIPELVEDILVKEDNVPELAKAIAYLLDHPHVWKKMGLKNKKIVAAKYSPKNAELLKEVFRNAP